MVFIDIAPGEDIWVRDEKSTMSIIQGIYTKQEREKAFTSF